MRRKNYTSEELKLINNRLDLFNGASYRYKFKSYISALLILITIVIAGLSLLYVPLIVKKLEANIYKSNNRLRLEDEIKNLREERDASLKKVPKSMWVREIIEKDKNSERNLDSKNDYSFIWNFGKYTTSIIINRTKNKVYQFSLEDRSLHEIKLPLNGKIEQVIPLHSWEADIKTDLPSKYIFTFRGYENGLLIDQEFNKFIELSLPNKNNFSRMNFIDSPSGICAYERNHNSPSIPLTNFYHFNYTDNRWEHSSLDINLSRENFNIFFNQKNPYSNVFEFMNVRNTSSDFGYIYTNNACKTFKTITPPELKHKKLKFTFQDERETQHFVFQSGVFKEKNNKLEDLGTEEMIDYFLFDKKLFGITNEFILKTFNSEFEWEAVKKFEFASSSVEKELPIDYRKNVFFTFFQGQFNFSFNGLDWIKPSPQHYFFPPFDSFLTIDKDLVEVTKGSTILISLDKGRSFERVANKIPKDLWNMDNDIDFTTYFSNKVVILARNNKIIETDKDFKSWESSSILLGIPKFSVGKTLEGQPLFIDTLGYLYYKRILPDTNVLLKMSSKKLTVNEKDKLDEVVEILNHSEFAYLPAEIESLNDRISVKSNILELLIQKEELDTGLRIEKHIIRFSIFAAMLYIVQILVGTFRYNKKMSDFYKGRFNTLRLVIAFNQNAFENIDINVFISLLTPPFEFNQKNEVPLEAIVSAAQKLNSKNQ
ncbi:hypothetical protein [Alteromonas confluentis]|uniref:Uncharacterized protein n=1 Tax=Alteromonas confluentis TaxID=1656094 RepID=A0A1E7Z7Y3_9ALTE|nr:hypothetical protein [Alteromonas confluentis]OFC69561.1 hypothetical protein BFC18_17725 [Alteromonas confluentis]